MIAKTFRVLSGALPLALAALSALHCGSGSPPLNVLTSSGSGSGGDNASSSSSGASGSGGSAPIKDGGSGSGGADASPPDQDAGTPPLCDPSAQWGSANVVPGLAPDLKAARFAITPNELTAAWIVDLAPPVLFVADRSDKGQAFDAAKAVTGYFGVDGLALSPDGLRVLVVRADQQAIAELVRATTSDALGAPDESAFAAINAATQTGMAYSLLGDPVLGQGDRDLFFSGYGLGGTTSVYEAYRDMPAAPWPTPSPRGAGPVQVVDGARRHPTGLSVDGRTLFLWDDHAPATGRAAYRPDSNGELTMSLDLGARGSVSPNADCTRLYYLSSGAPRFSDAM